MSATMRAVALTGVGRLELVDVPRPTPGPRDVLLSIDAVGLCGTDFHIHAGEANYAADDEGRPVPLDVAPQVLGHEFTGTVEEVGAEVHDLEPGDRVAVDQGLNCVSAAREERCEYCATGASHQCAHYREHGITGLPGGLAEALAVPAVNCVRLAGDLSPAEAALTEPLACVLHSSAVASSATARYALGAADPERRVRSLVVLGAGPAGLLFVQVLRNLYGFDGRLIVSEPNPVKRALAERFGAETVDPGAVDLAAEVRERTGGRLAEFLVEATGSGVVYAELPRLMRKQATVLQYGIGHGETPLALLNPVHWKEPTFVLSVGASGGFDADGRPTVYRRALSLLESGRVQVAELVTDVYRGLERAPEAFAGDHLRGDYVKGVVTLR